MTCSTFHSTKLFARAVLLASIVLVATVSRGSAQPSLSADLAPLAFLIGKWDAGNGKVADTGQTSHGFSTIGVDANGGAIVRRDHTELTGADGKAGGGFDQVMLIYFDQNAIRAEYVDRQHVIHYDHVTVSANHTAVFTSVATAGAPVFRLTYELEDGGVLSVRFEVEPPGATSFSPIATGTLQKVPQ